LKLNIVCSQLFSFFTNLALAGEQVGPAVPTAIDSGWSMGITIRGNYDNSQGCTNSVYVRFDKSSADYNTAQSIILMALAAQKILKFYVDGCNGSFANATWVEVSN
jgi:hypothetical protein